MSSERSTALLEKLLNAPKMPTYRFWQCQRVTGAIGLSQGTYEEKGNFDQVEIAPSLEAISMLATLIIVQTNLRTQKYLTCLERQRKLA